MNLVELFVVAVGLSMDAFAVSICKGLSLRQMSWGKAGIVGLYFGGFQAFMPLIGYGLGMGFQERIQNIDHWIAFILLGAIGLNMIKESFGSDECCTGDLDFKNMSLLALATSIDALAVGVTFAFLQVAILPAVSFIGVTTLLLCIVGVKIGNHFGDRYKSKAELAGGVVLLLMALKILLEHLGVL